MSTHQLDDRQSHAYGDTVILKTKEASSTSLQIKLKANPKQVQQKG